MQKSILLTLSIFLCSLPALSHAAKDCNAKKQAIKKQIVYAEKYANSYRVAGLKRALSNVNQYCTDSSLQQERLSQISNKQRKVIEKENDLREAIEKNDPKKIAKQKTKLAEAKQELRKAQAE